MHVVCSVEVNGVKGRHNFTLSILLFIYCLVVTIVSLLCHGYYVLSVWFL